MEKVHVTNHTMKSPLKSNYIPVFMSSQSRWSPCKAAIQSNHGFGKSSKASLPRSDMEQKREKHTSDWNTLLSVWIYCT